MKFALKIFQLRLNYITLLFGVDPDEVGHAHVHGAYFKIILHEPIAHGLKYKINFDGSEGFVTYLGCV